MITRSELQHHFLFSSPAGYLGDVHMSSHIYDSNVPPWIMPPAFRLMNLRHEWMDDADAEQSSLVKLFPVYSSMIDSIIAPNEMIELYRVQNSGLAIARYTVDAEPPLPNRECASYEKRYMTISDYSNTLLIR